MRTRDSLMPWSLTLMSSLALVSMAHAGGGDDGARTVHAIRDATPTVVDEVVDNITPDGFAIDDATNTIYVLGTSFNFDANTDTFTENSTLSILNGKTDTITRNIQFDSQVLQGVIKERGRLLVLVTDETYTQSTLMAMDAKTGAIVKSVPLGGPGFADDMLYDRKTNKLFLPAWNGPVTVLDTKTLQVIDTIPGDNSYLIAMNKRTGRIYVTNIYDATVSVIDGKTDQIIDTIQEGTPASPDGCYVDDTCTVQGSHAHGVSINEKTDTVYVTNEDGTFVTIDGKTDQVLNTITVANNEIYDSVVNEKTNTVFVAVPYDGVVAVIDGKTNQIVDELPMGDLPTPAGCQDFNSQVACTDSGVSPQGIAINHKTGKVYVGVDDDISSGSPNGKVVVIGGTKP